MSFNLKVLEYPNGNIQIRWYSDLIREEFEQKEKFDHYGIEPFTEQRCIVTKYETIEERKAKEQNSKFNSYNRTKNMIYTYARCCDWKYFITLTISPDSMDRYDFKVCSKKIRKWLNHQKDRFANDLKYIIVPEQHIDGAWHFHGLLADTGDMQFIDSGKQNNGDVIYNLEKYRYGFTTATKVKDINKVSKYIGKYITKTLCENTKGKQRYFVSQNLQKPIETNRVLEHGSIDDFIKTIEDSTGTKLTFVSERKGGYNECQYFELQ